MYKHTNVYLIIIKDSYTYTHTKIYIHIYYKNHIVLYILTNVCKIVNMYYI